MILKPLTHKRNFCSQVSLWSFWWSLAFQQMATAAGYISSFRDKSSDNFREIEGMRVVVWKNGRESRFPHASYFLTVSWYIWSTAIIEHFFSQFGLGKNHRGTKEAYRNFSFLSKDSCAKEWSLCRKSSYQDCLWCGFFSVVCENTVFISF